MTANENIKNEVTRNEGTKERIIALLAASKDESGRIDIGAFRRQHPSEYALLNHHFGSVADAVACVQGVKVARTQRKVTLRDILAYQHLATLREDNTLDDIAKRYGVTRMAINQLFRALEASVKEGGVGEVVDERVDED